MKTKLLILVVCCGFFQGCSWVNRFFVVNTTGKPVTVEIKLNKNVTSFPIFHYRELYAYPCENKKPEWGQQKEILADTLEDYSHFKVQLPAHTALEIGRLQNDKYEKYDQYFINGRVFNLEQLLITSGGKETKIVATTFDKYFSKENGEIFYFVK